MRLTRALPPQVSTLIGYGSPNKADTHDVHGAPLGKDETAATRKNLQWPYGEFEVRSTLSMIYYITRIWRRITSIYQLLIDQDDGWWAGLGQSQPRR